VRLQETSFADGTDPALAALERDGGVIVHGFIPQDVLAEFRADMQAAARQRHFGSASDSDMVQFFWGAQTMRFTRLATRSSAFFDILGHRDFLSLADHLLLPNCTNYWMNTAQMIILAPGQPGQWLHRDADNWPEVNRRDGFEVTISCMFAIDDFTEENGATQVVPGSHHWDDFDNRYPEPDEITQAVMPAGSGMLYTGRVMHGGGANVTENEHRWGLHLSFVLGWLVPEEALPLSVPWEFVRDQPERIQQLLGWRSTSLADRAGRLWTVDYEDVPVGLNLTSDPGAP
jgi:ectoine hydroxylase-related dioxygenase (phytanoyl-CoA dioxygenase family)